MYMFSMLVSSVVILLICAFYTLFERHFLGHMQMRRGPKKVGPEGLLQPMMDGVKLFTKNLGVSWVSTMNSAMFYIGPILALTMSMILWSGCLNGASSTMFQNSVSLLLFLCISGLNVYPLISAGWASNSKYAFMGAVRGGAQTVSFEMALLFLVLPACIFVGTLKFLDYYYEMVPLSFVMVPMFLMWIPLIIAESNRAPFDFAEGESELVSGFNVEYGGIFFSLLFLGEYGAILAFCWFSSAVFGGMMGGGILIFFIIMFMLSRGLLPRYRMDLLVGVFWRHLMPVGLLGVIAVFLV